jgi:hypothetical protein
LQQIETKHVALLEEMVSKHKIADLDKAVRIAVQFAISDGNTQHIFFSSLLDPPAEPLSHSSADCAGSADEIFVKKRCNTCGGRKKKVKQEIKLYSKMHAFLDRAAQEHKMKTVDVSCCPNPSSAMHTHIFGQAVLLIGATPLHHPNLVVSPCRSFTRTFAHVGAFAQTPH